MRASFFESFQSVLEVVLGVIAGLAAIFHSRIIRRFVVPVALIDIVFTNITTGGSSYV